MRTILIVAPFQQLGRQRHLQTKKGRKGVKIVDPSYLKLPTIDILAVIGRIFLMAYDVDGSVNHAEVMHYVESMDDKTEQYLVH
eukprot:9307262-Ditylum_brightwellii.AAC.1